MDTRKRGRGKPKSPAHVADEPDTAAETEKEIAPKLTLEKNRSENADKESENTKEIVDNGKTEEIELTEKPKDESSTESIAEPVKEANLERRAEAKQLDSNSIMESVEKQVESIMMGTDLIKDNVADDSIMKEDDSITKEDDAKEKGLKGKKRKIDLDSSKLDEDQMNVDMYPIGTKEMLGKGKRARIPNKRYSDVLLSPSHSKKSSLSAVENGNVIEKVEKAQEKVEKAQEKVEKAPEKVEKSLEKTESTNSGNETDTSVGHSDPKYLKPFEFGWKRELVWRLTYDESKGRQGDVYYFTPTGKKVRSRREVVEHLSNKDLTIDNFSFSKEEIGIGDPELEIIRNAKVGNTDKSLIKQAVNRSLKNTPLSSPKSPKLASAKSFSPKLASPKLASPKVETTETANSPSKIKPAKNIRMKTPAKKDVKETKKIEIPEEQMEVDEPPAKTVSSKKSRKLRSFGAKKASSSPSTAVVNNTTTVSTPAAQPKTTLKKRTIKLRSITTSSDEKDKDESKFMFNYLQNLSYGYNTLLYVFQYLKVQDLLRASCVCTMWRDIAAHPMLWKTVRMKNSQVHSFEGLANSLKKHGTIHLDLRKMLLPNGGDEIWPEFSKAIAKVETLRRIELCRCPASVVESLAGSNPQLEVINAVTIKCENMSLEPLKALTNINELRLKSTGGLTLTSNIDSLKCMKGLKHLSLTSIKDLDKMNLDVIADLSNLESLDLGECTDFPKDFGDTILIKLTKLERLRLEKGQGNCHTFEILEAVKQMDKLDQLELVNFDIKSGFDKALGACHNIRKLLIIPTYISQSATTNHMVLGGVRRLQKTLSHFVWGVTLELLRVTELFVDQCEEPKDKKDKVQVGNGDCIPVLKPVPLVLDKNSEVSPAFEPPQVEILALPSLQKLLMQNLPTTRVKILKIPFHATWRQSITDSVN